MVRDVADSASPAGASLDEAALIRGFEEATLLPDAFRHTQHVHVAWYYVTTYGMPAAIERFTAALKRFAQAKNVPTLYHQTITWAYLLLIAERTARRPAATWDEFAAANPDLLGWKPSILDRFYTPETLWSPLARTAFLMPDRMPPPLR